MTSTLHLSQVKLTPRHLERKRLFTFASRAPNRCATISTASSRSVPSLSAPNPGLACRSHRSVRWRPGPVGHGRAGT